MSSEPSLSTRAKGLLVAGAMLAIFVGILVTISLTSPRPVVPTASDGNAEPAPDISNISPSGQGPGTLAGASRLFLQVVDPGNPTRVQAEIAADRSTPLPEERLRMDEPRATIYLEDGRRVHIAARSGLATIARSAGNRPTDAVLDGDVVVRVLPPGSDPGSSEAESIGSIVSRSLRLDIQRGELEITGEFSFTSRSLDLDGRGLVVLFDERARRVESLHIEETTRCVVRPGDPSKGMAAPPVLPVQPPSQGTSTTGSTPSRLSASPMETLYRLELPALVIVRQGDRTLKADHAECLVRLIDNSLAPGAIAPLSLMPASGGRQGFRGSGKGAALTDKTDPVEHSTPPGEPSPQSREPASDAGTADDAPITIAWEGPLEARLVTTAPELARDHVFVRFTSDRSVIFADPSSGMSGEAQRLEYAATRREAALLGSSGRSIRLAEKSRGVFEALRLNFSFATGVVRVPGAGSISGTGDEPARVSWTGEGEFQFEVSDGRLSGNLKEARLQGEVDATDRSGRLRANSLTVRFADDLAVREITGVGAVQGMDAEGGILRGDALTAQFADTDGRAVPTHVQIMGNTSARRENESLAGDRIEAWFTQDRKVSRIARLDVTGNAKFADGEGRHAEAPRIVAWPPSRVVRLEGPGSTVGRHDSTIRGELLMLDGEDSTLEVQGPGRVEHTIPGQPPVRANVEWTEGLFYDEEVGIARCVGDVKAVLTRAGGDVDTLTGDIVIAEIGARRKGEEARPARLDTIGSDKPASIEIRRYRPGETRTLERLLFIEGPRIVVEDEAGTLHVPGAGRLLGVDRRAARDRAAASPGMLPAETMHGMALLTWDGALHLDRTAGMASVEHNARLIHDREDGSPRTQIDADSIRARFRPGSGTNETAFDGELLSLQGKGAVRVRSGTRELTAPVLDYDAIAALVEAVGTSSQPVTVTDTNGASPARADRIRWFLRTDRIEATGLKPITTPR